MIYGITETPFGVCLIAHTDTALTTLSFKKFHTEKERLSFLKTLWGDIPYMRDDAKTKKLYQKYLHNKEGNTFLVSGTDFETSVWQALLEIKYGETKSYAEVAHAVGHRGAARAVGSACGKNRIGLFIPCHRVIAADGSLGGFGWGIPMKEKMLKSEEASVPF